MAFESSRSGSNEYKQHEAKGGHHQAGAGIKFGRQILGFVNCVPFLGYVAATCSPWSQREIHHLWWSFFEDSNGQHGGSSAHVFFMADFATILRPKKRKLGGPS